MQVRINCLANSNDFTVVVLIDRKAYNEEIRFNTLEYSDVLVLAKCRYN